MFVNILALLHAGVGEATIATIFALLNIPGITPRNMKKIERRAGCAIKSLAKESCDVTLKDEIEKSRFMTSQFSYMYDCNYDCLFYSNHRNINLKTPLIILFYRNSLSLIL